MPSVYRPIEAVVRTLASKFLDVLEIILKHSTGHFLWDTLYKAYMRHNACNVLKLNGLIYCYLTIIIL